MPAQLIDGKALSASIRDHVATEVARLKSNRMAVHLAAILVGDNPAAKVYAENQTRTCAQVGIEYSLLLLPESITQQELHATLVRLNEDESITGIMVHMPLPPHLNPQEIQYGIDVLKDVEGVNPANIGQVVYGQTIIAPATALAAVECVEATGFTIAGSEAVVVGASRIAGKPIALLLTERGATVTLCHILTRDVAAHTSKADIVVVAVGRPNLIGKNHIKPGAVVIDVGINRITSTDAAGNALHKTVGDVNFAEVSQIASHITPVPGGVGPMTVAMLLKNTLRAAKLVYRLENPFTK